MSKTNRKNIDTHSLARNPQKHFEKNSSPETYAVKGYFKRYFKKRALKLEVKQIQERERLNTHFEPI